MHAVAGERGRAPDARRVWTSLHSLAQARCIRSLLPISYDRALRLAARLACREMARCDAALRPSRLSAADVARDRLAEGLRWLPLFPFATSRCACWRVRAEDVPALGGGSLTPARRALERPMAMACWADRAPCLPSRTCSNSSRTNSPACVLGALPSRASLRALSMVFFSGILHLLERASPIASSEPP
jgi:hypothetical protein